MTIDTLTRTEYRNKTRNQYAGTLRALDPSAETIAAWSASGEWLGKHWHMASSPNGGVSLGPVNVVPDPK
jgi:hypothetical protein